MKEVKLIGTFCYQAIMNPVINPLYNLYQLSL